MLAGNSPVYSGISNDELLHLRLSEMPGYPIVLQDLKELSEVCVNIHHFEINENYAIANPWNIIKHLTIF